MLTRAMMDDVFDYIPILIQILWLIIQLFTSINMIIHLQFIFLKMKVIVSILPI